MEDLIQHAHNVLFVTLDSCRFDTCQKAETPVMDGIGKARCAETVASYTYPAHVSFFAGHLPVVRDKSGDDYFTKEGNPLWKLNVARNTSQAGLGLIGFSIQEGYRKKGYGIRGFGGTTFFPYAGQQLRRDFLDDEFQYFGNSTSKAPRQKETIPLANVDMIADSVRGLDNWFIFINDTSTHVPYHIDPVEPWLEDFINYASRFRAGRHDPDCPYSADDGKELHQLQVKALEYADRQLGQLLGRLDSCKPLMVVICGDHGESFGEKGRWGHFHNAPEVLNVPLLINAGYEHVRD